MAQTTTVERATDQSLADLIDALVEAIDVSRYAEVDRVRAALEPFGGVGLFDSEIRLNGTASVDDWCTSDEACICRGVS